MTPSPYGPDRFGPEMCLSCALDGLPFKKREKDGLVRLTRRFSIVYAVDVLGFSIMDNHFHLLVEMSPIDLLSDDEVRAQAKNKCANLRKMPL